MLEIENATHSKMTSHRLQLGNVYYIMKLGTERGIII